jgi:aromatic-L-amino-acid/L-tryptophan decarboxylase
VAPEPAEARRALADAAGWAASYLETAGTRPVLAQVAPGEIAASLPADPPEHGEPLELILADVDRLLMPGITHWNHPAFFAYFGITGSTPGVIGELLAATLNVNAMLWRTSPAATELEGRVLEWVAALLGLPRSWFGEITDTASASTFYALAAAREAAGLDVRERGLAGRSDLPPLRVYASEEAHSSVAKACIALGFGHRGLRTVPTDEAFSLDAAALAAAVAEDRAAGVCPIAAVATVGTTSTTSVDPVAAIADVCEREGMWLHVDAAYGGAAAIVPSQSSVLEGCERADSLVMNPHKWLLVPIDCSLLYTRRPDDLRAAFSLVPEYLRSDEEGVVNLMDYGLSLGRRFRALKLWMVLRAYGREGLADVLEGHMRLAAELAGWIEDDPGWELLAPVPFSTVCFRRRPEGVDDEEALRALNAALVERVNRSGEAFLSHTVLRGRYAVRLAIGNAGTQREHVEQAWRLLREAAAEVEPAPSGD